MNKQISLSNLEDELSQVRTKEKRISGADIANSSVERMGSNDKAVLLRRARELTIRPVINAEALPDTESV